MKILSSKHNMIKVKPHGMLDAKQKSRFKEAIMKKMEKI